MQDGGLSSVPSIFYCSRRVLCFKPVLTDGSFGECKGFGRLAAVTHPSSLNLARVKDVGEVRDDSARGNSLLDPMGSRGGT